MSGKKKGCGAITKKGTPCTRAAREEYGGLCAQHGKKKSDNNDFLSKSKTALGVGASFVGVAGGVIHAVTYISGHWDAIRHALSSLGISFITDIEAKPGFEHDEGVPLHGVSKSAFKQNRAQGFAEVAKELTDESTEIMTRQYCSEGEAIELRRKFSYWFKSLPDEVQQDARDHIGKERIEELFYQE